MTKLDLFYQISYESFATKMCERQINHIFPDSKIFKHRENLFVDKLGPHPSLSTKTAYEFYKLFDESMQESTADFMMILEPDVFVSKMPSTWPKEAGGITWNWYPKEIKDRIRMAWDLECPDTYSMAGGSVISVKAWKEKSYSLTQEDINEIIEIWEEAKAGDTLISMILLKFGIEIESWPEVYEAGLQSDINSASIFHGIKTWYNYQ